MNGIGQGNERDRREIFDAFREFVQQPEFSCLGAKTALHDDALKVASYRELASAESTAELSHDLSQFANSQLIREKPFANFVAIFQAPLEIDEIEFEHLLWQQLQRLHRIDDKPCDARARPIPADPEFSFSFAGRAFYVIGRHARSSRRAHQFPWPTLLFSSREQFDRLQAEKTSIVPTGFEILDQ
jgi:uncharacterized protein